MLARPRFFGVPLYVLVPGVVLVGLVVWFAVTLAVESREERRLEAAIDRASSELKSTGAQIACIKDADLQHG